MASAEVDLRNDEHFLADDARVLLFRCFDGLDIGEHVVSGYRFFFGGEFIGQGRHIGLALPTVTGNQGEEAQFVAVGHESGRASQLAVVTLVAIVLVGYGQQGLTDTEIGIIGYQLFHLFHSLAFQPLGPRHVSYQLLAIQFLV